MSIKFGKFKDEEGNYIYSMNQRWSKTCTENRWYRFMCLGMYDGGTSTSGGVININITTLYNYDNSVAYSITIYKRYKDARINLNGFNRKTSTTNVITDIRVVKDTDDNKVYVEFYYSGDTRGNLVTVSVDYDDKLNIDGQVKDYTVTDAVEVISSLNLTTPTNHALAKYSINEQIMKIYDALSKDVVVGEFVLWEGNVHFQENGSYKHLGIYYNAKVCLLETFPLRSGFTRTYNLVMDYSNTHGSSTSRVHVQFTDNKGTYLGGTDKVFGEIWGGTEDGTRTRGVMSFDVDTFLGNNHVNISISPTFNTGSYLRVYKIAVQIVDKLSL